MRRRLLWHIVLVQAAVGLGVVLGMVWLATHTLNQAYQHEQWDKLAVAAATLAEQLADPQVRDQPAEAQRLASWLSQTTNTRLTVVDPQGNAWVDSHHQPATMDSHLDRPEIAAALAGRRGQAQRYSSTLNRRMLYLAVPIRSQGQIVGAVRAALDEQQIDAALRGSYAKLLAGAGVILVAGLLLGWVFVRQSIRPIEELAEDASRLARGESALRLPLPEIAEPALLAEALNTLAAQLEEHSHLIGRQGHEQEAVLASMVEGVLAVDSDHRVISINRAAANLMGARQADAAGRSLPEVIRNADLRNFAARALESDEPIEDDIVLHGERPRALRIRGTALRDAAARTVGAVIVMHDMTHFRHLENVRRDFVANVSHELKTPIASIKGFVETLLDGALHQPEDAERFLRIVAKQADRLNAIIEDLLSLSKIEQSEEAGNLALEEGQIADVLEAVLYDCQSKAQDRQISVRVACDDALRANINPPLLEQAVNNLLDNAIKYSEPGSDVSISASQQGGEVSISVSDHGCGIDQEHLPRLFERFYRVDRARSRKLGGTGLGLAIVKHIVQAHGGRISVTSAPGQGSTFTIHLPALRAAPQSAAWQEPLPLGQPGDAAK